MEPNSSPNNLPILTQDTDEFLNRDSQVSPRREFELGDLSENRPNRQENYFWR